MGTLLPLLGVFATVGLIELTDRTNFALIGFASRRGGFPTWAGAATAFLITSAIAVAIGTLVLAFLSPELRFIQVGGGALILAYAGYLYLRPEAAEQGREVRSAFLSAFLLILVLEMGDSTMIVLVLFTGSLGDPLGVFGFGAAALVGVDAFACTVGRQLGQRVDPRQLDRLVVAILGVVGTVTILIAIDPGLLPPFLSGS